MNRSPPFLKCIRRFSVSKREFRSRRLEKESTVAEILRVSVGVPEIVVDEHGGLSG
jgi:hypothetical protein